MIMKEDLPDGFLLMDRKAKGAGWKSQANINGGTMNVPIADMVCIIFKTLIFFGLSRFVINVASSDVSTPKNTEARKVPMMVKNTADRRMIPTEIKNLEYGVLFAQIALKLIVSYLCGEDKFSSGLVIEN